jgi:Kef-type K+ transport system membrane component KefB
MKTIAELKKIATRFARVLWIAWTGADILLLALLTLLMIICEPVVRIITILSIILVICYQIGKIYDKIFE